MTLETRQIIEVGDIDSISLECPTCHTRVMWTIQPERQLLMECPSCRTSICPDGTDVRRSLIAFLQSARALTQALKVERCPVGVRLSLTPTTRPVTPS